MSIMDNINADLKAAMIAKNADELTTVRMLLSALHNKRIETSKDTVLTDDDVMTVIRSEVKKRKDSMESYKQGGRQDLVDKEEAEIKIIMRYMPEQMSTEELDKITSETLAAMPEITAKDFGKAMGAVMAKVKGKTDGNAVSIAVKRYFGN